MRIVYLTAGAAGMYCGSCLHDNALVKALQRQGHDAILQPIYTPIVTDQEDISNKRLFLGGINVYLQQVSPLFRKLPGWLDGVLNSARLVGWVAARASNRTPRNLGALTVSMLRGPRGNQRKEMQRLADWLAELQPDVVIFSNLMIAGCIDMLREKLDAVMAVVLQGDDIFFEGLPEPWRTEAMAELRSLSKRVDLFFAHSLDYGKRMAELLQFDVARLSVVPLGIDADDLFTIRRDPSSEHLPAIGYLARIAPEKGLHLLVEAFRHVRAEIPQAQLHIAGWLGREHEAYWQEQKKQLAAASLADCYTYYGTIDRAEKRRFLSRIDILSVPTTYREPKGMFVLEGLAAGVPYVEPAHGAFPEIHQRLGGGRLFPPGDVQHLVDLLIGLLSDRQEARQLGTQGREALKRHGTVDTEAKHIVDQLQRHIAPSTP
ncbi:MAG: glycosyl transferase family 1 [Pirellulaceae bacterium]|nr:MAG: glycosyl transferase family 1 [Pirellulaceae bacterium]